MTRYLAIKFSGFLLVVFGVSVLVFLMLHLVPGDPVSALVGDAPVSAAEMERLREQYGLNDPLYVQYGRFVANALQGDLGRSLRTRRPVVEEIGDQLPQTIELAVAAVIFAVILGVVLGVVAATHHQTWIDTVMYGGVAAQRVDAELLARADADLHLRPLVLAGSRPPARAARNGWSCLLSRWAGMRQRSSRGWCAPACWRSCARST